MTFTELSTNFQELEKTTSRNTMTEILAGLFKKSPVSDIGKICYLLQGRVAPLYEPIEFGMADKMVMRAIAMGLNIDQADVNRVFKETGDLGETVYKIKNQISNIKNTYQKLNISEVFCIMEQIAYLQGAGSQDKKIELLGNLIKAVDPLSGKYIARILLGKLRLGFSDMTILDSLSWMLVGTKEAKKELERAYNVRPDLGYLAQAVKEKGLEGVKHVVPKPGTPIMMARANRLTSSEEIIEKLGKCAVEYKYDGLRLQVHLQKLRTKNNELRTEIKMFSRNLEDVTPMFPDIEEAVRKQVKADNVVFEGEVVAYNPKNGVFVPFQETMQRKRKYDIAAKALEIPVKLFVFELLLSGDKSYLTEPYIERKKELKRIIEKGTVIVYAQEHIIEEAHKVEEVFDESVKLHFEGIIAKKLDGVYEAGVRGWNWIKFKRAMHKKLADTLDVLVMGYTKGEGKRTAFGVGQFLTGIYDKKQDKFVTVTKIGTGLTDEQFHEFFKRVAKLHAKEKPPLYEVDKLLEPDAWLEPGLVVEVSCDEITRSTVHTAGRVMEPSKSGKAFSVKTPGYALRFPRLERFRDDRRPEDATSVAEIEQMFRKQGKS